MQHYVFWFDIAVDDLQRMYFVDGIADLLHDVGDLDLSHWFGFPQLMIELSSCPHFEDDVDVCFVVKEAVHLDDVWVVKIGLNLEFPDELLSDFLFLQQFLLDFLESTGKPCISLPTFSFNLLYKRHLTVLTRS